MDSISGEPLTYPYDEAAARLGVSLRTLKRLVADGAIRHVRVRGRVLFTERDLEDYLARHARGGAPGAGGAS